MTRAPTPSPGDPFAERIAVLRVGYSRGLEERARSIEEQAQRLGDEDAMDASRRAELDRYLHNLIGTSGVHGLTAVVDAGQLLLARLQAPATRGPVGLWRETIALVELLRAIAAESCAEPPR